MWKTAFNFAKQALKTKKKIDEVGGKTKNNKDNTSRNKIIMAVVGLMGTKAMVVVTTIVIILVPLTFSLMSIRNTLDNIQTSYYQAKTLTWDAAMGFFTGEPDSLKYEKYLQKSFEIIEGKIQSKSVTEHSDIQALKFTAIGWVYKQIYTGNFHSTNLINDFIPILNGKNQSKVPIWNEEEQELDYRYIDDVRSGEYINVFDIEAFDYVAGPLVDLLNFDIGAVRTSILKENQETIDKEIEEKTLPNYQSSSVAILNTYIYYNNLAIDKANEVLSKNNQKQLDVSGKDMEKLNKVLTSGDKDLINSNITAFTDNLKNVDLTVGDVTVIKTQVVTSTSDFWHIYNIKDQLSKQFSNLIKSKNLPKEIEQEIIKETNSAINQSKYRDKTLSEHTSRANSELYEQTKALKQKITDDIVDPKVQSSIEIEVGKLGLEKSSLAAVTYRDALKERTTEVKSELTRNTFKNTVETAVKIVAQKVYANKLSNIDSENANGMYIPNTTTLIGNKNAEQAYNFLLQEGFSPVSAAACIGNWVQESNLNTTIENPDSKAYGLCQWLGGRKTGLFTFASSHGGDATSLLTQLQYFIYETKTSEKNDFAQTHSGYKYPNGNTWEDFKKETNINIAVEAFRRSFERCGEAEANDTTRLNSARDVLAAYGNGTTSTAPTTSDNKDDKSYYYANGQQLIKWQEYYGDNKNNKVFENADKWATEEWQKYQKENSGYTIPDKKLSELIINSINHYSDTAGGIGNQQIQSVISTYLNLDCDFKIIDSDTKKPVANEQEVDKKIKEIGDDLIDCINIIKGKDFNFAIYLLTYEKGEDRHNAFNGIKDMTDFSKFVNDSYKNTQNSNTSIPEDFVKVAKLVSGDKNINVTDFFSISSNAGVNVGQSIDSADEFYKLWVQAKITLTETYNMAVEGDHISYPGESAGAGAGGGSNNIQNNYGPYTGDLKILDTAVLCTNQNEFAKIVAPYATYLYNKYGIFPGVQIANMINEGWNGSNGFSNLAKKQFNLGGVGGLGHYLTYDSVADYMEQWCEMMNINDDRGYYKYVTSKTTPMEQMDGFSNTQYAQAGQDKDDALMAIYRDDKLSQYDEGLSRDNTQVSSSAIVNEARKYLGIRYVWGGETPEGGFDCSGFVQYVYAKQGITIPRQTGTQCYMAGAVDVNPTVEYLQPGDLIFFGTAKNIHHVAMYTGNGMIIHAPSSGNVIKEVPIYYKNLFAAKRYLK